MRDIFLTDVILILTAIAMGSNLAYQVRLCCQKRSKFVDGANGGCGRHRPHRGLKVKSHTHCMETQELCKNSEGDPATPGLAATTCWRPHQCSRFISKRQARLTNLPFGWPELHALGNQTDLGIRCQGTIRCRVALKKHRVPARGQRNPVTESRHCFVFASS